MPRVPGCLTHSRYQEFMAKPPLKPKEIWSIRTRLQLANRKRDLALFNLLDSRLRGCDFTSLRMRTSSSEAPSLLVPS